MSVLSTSTNALIAFQRALGTVSHNVANIGTEGYSRQRVEFATRNPTDYGFGYVGNGVKINDIQRVADQLANARLLDSGGELSRLKMLSGLSNRVDALVSTPATNLASSWSNFFDSLSALSANAASTAERQSVLSQANALTTRFAQMDAQLDALSEEVNNGLRSATDEINRLASEIARLNASIANDAGGASPDLLDRRDRLITDLVAYTGATTVTQDNAMVNVMTPGGQPLVVGATATRLSTQPDPYRPDQLRLSLVGNGQNVQLDARAFGGSVGGMLAFRSDVLEPTMAELGRIAAGLVTALNQGHQSGADLHGNMGGPLFTLPAPLALPHAGNSSGTTLQASFADIGQVDGANLVLRFDGGTWTAQRADTGAAVPVTWSGAPGDPLQVNGISINVNGTPANGERFLLQPTALIAGGLGVAITDPSRLAAASPVKATADIGNIGTGMIAGLTITDATNPDLRNPAIIEFIDAGQYTIDGNGPFAYTPGQPISANGWSFTLDGTPAAGDSFQIQATGAGSSDNGNAALLANLDDASVLSGGTVSLNGAVAGLTTSVGAAARQAEYSADAQQVIHDQALATRESISGVNLNEEAADMLRMQQAYMAASQLIATADTMFQSLLSAVRR